MSEEPKNPDEPAQVGRRYRGESAVVTTPEASAEVTRKNAEFSGKKDAMPIAAYFSAKGILNPIMQASMLAYTDVRVATSEDFDVIFAKH